MATNAYVAVYDTLADWELGYLMTELRTGRYIEQPWTVRTVAATAEPVTSMGGLRIEPDLTLAELDPADADLFVLGGATQWDAGDGLAPFAAAAGRFLAAGVPVAAICGATAGLARAGLLDHAEHTSAAPEYLAATGYAGGEHYVTDRRAVADGLLITAGPQSPVHFAAATLRRLGLIDDTVGNAYVAVMHDGDASAYPALMRAKP